MTEHNDDYVVENCPACGQPGDYCQGHGMMGDPLGYSVLQRHDSEDHSQCHANAPCTQLSGTHMLRTGLVVIALLAIITVLFGPTPNANAAARHHRHFNPAACPSAWEAPHSKEANACRRHGWIIWGGAVIGNGMVIGPDRQLHRDGPQRWVRMDAMRRCSTEDDPGNCVWWAGEQGNGRGTSFVHFAKGNKQVKGTKRNGRTVFVRGFFPCRCNTPGSMGDDYNSGA